MPFSPIKFLLTSERRNVKKTDLDRFTLELAGEKVEEFNYVRNIRRVEKRRALPKYSLDFSFY